MRASVRNRFLLFLAAVCLFAACRQKREVNPPPTYPVQGTVKSTSGRIPVGCRIEFMPDDAKKMAEGEIGADGMFTLKTRYEGVVCDGAAEGTYQVTIVPPLGGAPTGISRPIALPTPIQIKPEDNRVVIPLP